MAVPRKIGSFEDKKFRENLALLLKTARRTLFSAPILTNLTNDGLYVEVLRKEFSPDILTAYGETIEVFGTALMVPRAAGEPGAYLAILDEDDVVIASLAFAYTTSIDVAFKYSIVLFPFSSSKYFFTTLQLVTDDPTQPTNVTKSSDVRPVNLKKLKVVFYLKGDGDEAINVLGLKGEFSPS